MELPQSTNVEFWFFASDVNPDGYLDWGYGWELTFNKAKISDHPYEFDASSFIDIDVQPALQPYSGYTFFSDGSFKAPFFHKFSINTSEFTPGRTHFVRLYFQDDDHSQPIEFPRLGTPAYLVSLMSFVVSP
ncbi:MAG: hypothetical protein ACI959_000771 [Limisphaerales bacterium]|jgi:hypothetical protein